MCVHGATDRVALVDEERLRGWPSKGMRLRRAVVDVARGDAEPDAHLSQSPGRGPWAVHPGQAVSECGRRLSEGGQARLYTRVIAQQ